MRQVTALLVSTALALPPTLAAQISPPLDPSGDHGRIDGRVMTEQGTGLADVSIIVLEPVRVGTVSDAVGRFTLSTVPPGTVDVLFERLGYASTVMTVELAPGATRRVEAIMVADAIELDAIEVTIGGGPPFLEINGFYRRSRRGFGQQFSRTSLDELEPLEVADAVRRVPGIRLQYDTQIGNRVLAMSPRVRRLDGRTCALTVYVDGARALDPNVNQVPPDWLVAMEVYLGADTPARFRTADNCGVVLLWTKRRGPGS